MRRLIKNIFATLTSLVILGVAPVYAEGPLKRPSGYEDPSDYAALLGAVFLWIFVFILIISVIMLLRAAFLYLTAGDDEEKIKKAKSIIMYAIIALVIAFVAKGVPPLIEKFLFGTTTILDTTDF